MGAVTWLQFYTTLLNIWSESKPFITFVLKPKTKLCSVLGQLWWTFLIHFKCWLLYFHLVNYPTGLHWRRDLRHAAATAERHWDLYFRLVSVNNHLDMSQYPQLPYFSAKHTKCIQSHILMPWQPPNTHRIWSSQVKSNNRSSNANFILKQT